MVSISFFFKAIVLADAGGSQDYLKLLEFGRNIQPPAVVRQLRYDTDGKRPKEGFHSKILQGQVNDEHGNMRTDITSFTSGNIFPSVWKYISKNMEIYFQEPKSIFPRTWNIFQEHGNIFPRTRKYKKFKLLFFHIKKGYSLQVGI